MLHGSETWPETKQNELTLQRAATRMISWMCVVKVTIQYNTIITIQCSVVRWSQDKATVHWHITQLEIYKR